MRDIILEEDELWIQGDNLHNSVDSRSHGPVKTSTVQPHLVCLNATYCWAYISWPFNFIYDYLQSIVS